MYRHRWRRFRPHGLATRFGNWPRTDIWRQATQIVDEMFVGRRINENDLERDIQTARDRAGATNDPVMWCTALILQAPQAAIAQEQIDQHPHNYRYKHERLYELIDFNDAFVAAVLTMPDSGLADFAGEAKRALDRFCKRMQLRCFSDEQFEAIVHGLSHEIALYRGALAEGFDARMTSKIDDALGIDMIITDRNSGRAINVDCKTHASFYYRLKDLVREGRLTTEQSAVAEDNGYAWEVNEDGARQERIVLLRVDRQTYGDIRSFSFDNPTILGKKLAMIIDMAPRESSQVYS